jgi:integrase
MTLKGVLTTADARKEARAVLGAVARGSDPLGERRKAEASALNTLKAVCENFLIREGGAKRDPDGNLTFEKGNGKLRTAAERHATFERHVYKKLGPKQIDAIKRSDINALLDKIEDESGAAMADHTLAYLRRVFNWHAARSDDFRSPIVRGMARGSAANKRDRILTDEELRAFWKACENWKDHAFPAMLRFILLTATRRDEAADMVWSEIEGDIWLIPAHRYKTDIDFEVPLSEAAQDVLSGVTKLGRKGFVFTTNGTTSVNNFSDWKKRFDGLMLTELRKLSEERRDDTRKVRLPRWTIHDLRRTARSLMTRAGVPGDHAERALGHIIGGVRGVYDRHTYRDEKRRAFDALAALIERIVNHQPNVITLSDRQAANG